MGIPLTVDEELTLEAMRMYRDFIFSDDARAAVESWARGNRKETWTELDGLATRTLGMSAAGIRPVPRRDRSALDGRDVRGDPRK